MPVVDSCVGQATVVLVQLFYQVTNLGSERELVNRCVFAGVLSDAQMGSFVQREASLTSGPISAGHRRTGRSLLLPMGQRTDVNAPFETQELPHPVFFYDDVLVMPHHADHWSAVGGTAQHGPHDRSGRAGSI